MNITPEDRAACRSITASARPDKWFREHDALTQDAVLKTLTSDALQGSRVAATGLGVGAGFFLGGPIASSIVPEIPVSLFIAFGIFCLLLSGAAYYRFRKRRGLLLYLEDSNVLTPEQQVVLIEIQNR